MNAPLQMTTTALEQLQQQWAEAKMLETQAQERRRELEDQMVALMQLAPDFEGTKAVGELKVTARLNRRIDSDKLQELAACHGLSEQLGKLFRWKPELAAREWAKAPEEVKSILSQAVTVSPSRPSFSIKGSKGE